MRTENSQYKTEYKPFL